jgi:hypothetical protein
MAAAAAIALSALAAPGAQQQDIFGFTAASQASQRELERRFLALPSADRARDFHRYLTDQPHVAGSERNRHLAEWMRETWKEYGFDTVEIVEHQVLLPHPVEMSLSMGSWQARFTEDPIPGDPDTEKPLLHYNAYSRSGEIEAPVVYAASGNPENYDWLESQGIDVRGKIVLVRYSVPYSYRGFKALTAEKRGAAAMLIYSDPAEDGAKKGLVYPDGPWGNESHIQSGGIPYDFLVPGDPLTPGWAAGSACALAGRPRHQLQGGADGGPCTAQGGGRRQGAADSDSDRHDQRQRAARRARDPRQPSRRVAVRRRRSVERLGGDDGPGAVARRAGARRRQAETLRRLCQLGRRGVHAHLLHGVGRAVRVDAA